MDDWLDQLRQIRAEQETEARQPEVAPENQASQLLQQVNAFKYLRDIRKVLLGGVGRIELLENVGGYASVLALTWDGPVASAQPPLANSPEMRHIFIGVRDKKLWVNGHLVADATPEALQARLLEAARQPGRRADLRHAKE